MRVLIAALLTTFAILISLPVAADWPMPRNNLAHTGAADTTGPMVNTVRWIREPFPSGNGESISSLAISGNRLYWTGVKDYAFSTHAYVECLNANTGFRLWSREISDAEEARFPTVAGSRVYFHLDHFDTYYGTNYGGSISSMSAINGSPSWEYYPDYPYNTYMDPPVVADGIVLTYYNYDDEYSDTHFSKFVALDAGRGGELWSFVVDGNSAGFVSPSVSNGRVYTGWRWGTAAGEMICFDLYTGETIWSYPLIPCISTYLIARSPAIGNGMIIHTNCGPAAIGLFALDANTGELIWKRPDLGQPTVAVTDQAVYAYSSGVVDRLNPDTGETVWTQSIPTSSYIFAPVVGNEYMYLSTYTDGLYCLNLETGSILWTDHPDTNINPSALTDGRLYVSRRNEWWSDSVSQIICYEVDQSLDAQLACSPPPGQPAVDAVVDLSLTNLVPDFTRRFFYRLSLTLPDGSFDSPWRQGWQNVQAGQTWTTSFTHDFPGLEGDWGTVLFELEAQDVTPAPYNQPPYAPSGTVAHDACSAEAGVVDASLTCEPSSGTLPFASRFGFSMTNTYTGLSRRLDYDITVTLANGQIFPHWRRGWQNVQAGQTFNKNWWQAIPAYNSLVGVNTFGLTVTDVTPPPYNQLPYPPAGDTDVDQCTITGSEAP